MYVTSTYTLSYYFLYILQAQRCILGIHVRRAAVATSYDSHKDKRTLFIGTKINLAC